MNTGGCWTPLSTSGKVQDWLRPLSTGHRPCGNCLGDSQGKFSFTATGIFCSDVAFYIGKLESDSCKNTVLPKHCITLYQCYHLSFTLLYACGSVVTLPEGMIHCDQCKVFQHSCAETADFCGVSKFNIACQHNLDFFFNNIFPIDKSFYSDKILLWVITRSFIVLPFFFTVFVIICPVFNQFCPALGLLIHFSLSCPLMPGIIFCVDHVQSSSGNRAHGNQSFQIQPWMRSPLGGSVLQQSGAGARHWGGCPAEGSLQTSGAGVVSERQEPTLKLCTKGTYGDVGRVRAKVPQHPRDKRVLPAVCDREAADPASPVMANVLHVLQT